RVARLKGVDQPTIRHVLTDKITLTPGGPALIATMRAHGAHTVLVSGGFSIFTAAIAKRIGFHDYRANELMLDTEGRLSGQLVEPILGREGKRQALQHFREKLSLAVEETLAVGDGANDLGMLEAAGFGVAFHAKPRVASATKARIDYGDLTALLYVQGYRHTDFVENFTHGSGDSLVKGAPVS
ncbi:MAG TPA: HAD family phosphatase, partial [Methylocella sp.]|nr:HAD family phosphatase [Methylocella sp.]